MGIEYFEVSIELSPFMETTRLGRECSVLPEVTGIVQGLVEKCHSEDESKPSVLVTVSVKLRWTSRF